MITAALSDDIKFTDLRDGITVVVFLLIAAALAAAALRSLRTAEDPTFVIALTVALVALAVTVALGMYQKISNDAVAGIVGAVIGLASAGGLRRGERTQPGAEQRDSGPGSA